MSEWISVKERLPGSLQQVFVWVKFPDEHPMSSDFNRGWYTEGFGRDGWYTGDFGAYQYYQANTDLQVTHWMPIPDPPEES